MRLLQCCFTFTESVGLVGTSRDRDARTSTSNFAQLLSSEACRLSSGAQMCEGTVAGHSNADVMMPVAWPAAVACGLCLCRLNWPSLHKAGIRGLVEHMPTE